VAYRSGFAFRNGFFISAQSLTLKLIKKVPIAEVLKVALILRNP
jgi:hypothetical protein